MNVSKSFLISLVIFGSGKLFAAKPPNIILILADDMGWSDPGCFGNNLIHTPNIDRMATQGMKFTNAYADPVCAPTRAALQTGKYSARLNYTTVQNEHWRPYGMLKVPAVNQFISSDEITIAEHLKKAGYVSGIFGKWHLGDNKTSSSPGNQGYVYPLAVDMETSYNKQLNLWIKNNPQKGIGEQVQQGIRFIEQNKDKPFFCMFSYNMVHTALEAREDLITKYKKLFAVKRTIIHPAYAAMCEVVDESAGLIDNVLRTLNLYDNTIVIFCSDNGGVISERNYLAHGWEEPVTCNWPLRGEKGGLYEGGIRVPLIVRWPNKIKKATVCQTPVMFIDLFPTFSEIAGLSVPDNIDGKSIVPILLNNGKFIRDELFWHYPHYHHSTPASAVRSGDFKLIKFYEKNRYELYNLKNDIGEQFNLADSLPDKLKSLQTKLDNWLTQVNARFPAPNPNFDYSKELLWGPRYTPQELKKINN